MPRHPRRSNFLLEQNRSRLSKGLPKKFWPFSPGDAGPFVHCRHNQAGCIASGRQQADEAMVASDSGWPARRPYQARDVSRAVMAPARSLPSWELARCTTYPAT